MRTGLTEEFPTQDNNGGEKEIRNKRKEEILFIPGVDEKLFLTPGRKHKIVTF
jgi:hypothetical protein